MRAAIEETNANNNDATVVDAINFGVPGTGVKTISPGTALPDISEAVIINGYTQAGAGDGRRRHLGVLEGAAGGAPVTGRG